MKVACIFITCNRLDETLRCIQQNFFNAELDADVIWVDNGSDPEIHCKIAAAYPFSVSIRSSINRGISHAINAGLTASRDYDAVVTLANDILMPKGWLRAMTEAATRIHDTGMAAIHCVEHLPPLSELGVHENWKVFGNALITRQAIDTIGGFNTDFDPYGMQDSDYCYRLAMAGFRQYYIPGMKSEHIGHDVGQDSDYRRLKDKHLIEGIAKYDKWVGYYDSTGDLYHPLEGGRCIG